MHVPPILRGLAVSSALVVVATGCGVNQADLTVRVVDAVTGHAIVNAVVSVDYLERRSSMTGVAQFKFSPGQYEMSIEHPNYLPMTAAVSLSAGAFNTKTVALRARAVAPQPQPQPEPQPQPTWGPPGPGPRPSAPVVKPSAAPSTAPARDAAVVGRVTDDKGNRLKGATVYVESNWGIPVGNATTSAAGEFRVGKLLPGQLVKVTAIAEGFKSVTRQVAPTGEWQLDFTGQYALRTNAAPTPQPPDAPATIKVSGKVEDTMGRAIDGVMIRVESDNVRYPFNESVVARYGRFELEVPTDLSLRFSANKLNHRSVTFVQRVSGNGAASVDFTGMRALDPLPILEGG